MRQGTSPLGRRLDHDGSSMIPGAWSHVRSPPPVASRGQPSLLPAPRRDATNSTPSSGQRRKDLTGRLDNTTRDGVEDKKGKRSQTIGTSAILRPSTRSQEAPARCSPSDRSLRVNGRSHPRKCTPAHRQRGHSWLATLSIVNSPVGGLAASAFGTMDHVDDDAPTRRSHHASKHPRTGRGGSGMGGRENDPRGPTVLPEPRVCRGRCGRK